MTAINGSGKYVHTEWMINIYVYLWSQPELRTASANTRFLHYAVLMSMRGVMQVSPLSKDLERESMVKLFTNEYHTCYEWYSMFYMYQCWQSCRMHVKHTIPYL